MIKLVFSYNREPMNFIIKDRDIYYTDRRWGSWVRCVPPPENFIKIVSLSRNRIPSYLINLFKMTPEEIKEYEEAKTEEELANIIIELADENGKIQGRTRKFNAIDMAEKCINFKDYIPNVLTREYGIRQQAMHIIYYDQDRRIN